MKIVDQTIINAFLIRDVNAKNINKNFDLELTKRKANKILRNIRRNAHIERFFSNSNNFINENLNNFENVELFHINKPRVIKKKNRSKNSTNKKNLIICA